MIKYLADGNIDRFKTRLVAQGFNQKEGINYKETFASVAKMVIVRAFLAIVVSYNWIIEQLDINNAFLHGDLHEEVYIKIPQSYSTELPPNTVCKLTKSLYGLKQASRQWFQKLTSFLLSLKFQQSYADTSLFTLTQGQDFIALLVYVDDIILAGNNQSLINSIKQQLHHQFSIKDLGSLHYYLGIEILRNSSGIVMSQRKYALELIQHAGVLNDKPEITPLDPTVSLNNTYGVPLTDTSFYRTLVGKLIYLTITRPDFSFAAQVLSQFTQNPTIVHMKALRRVMRYIKLCPGQGLHFPSTTTLSLSAYCDSD
nr:retrovirus-related Pol polyprotein from transposon TNT 1-94 [Tanacetum cinerariifolium]